MNNVITVILGGGRGTRLLPLTLERAKPAVSFAGKYRLIDIPISNSINSGIKRVFVLTQFMSASLHRHVMQTYRFDTFSGGFVDILAAEQTLQRADWFQGTADAVRATLKHTMYYAAEQMLILSGDHLYRMDYADLIRFHRQKKADITICVYPVTRAEAPGMGLLNVDAFGVVEEFVEKPTDPRVIERFSTSQNQHIFQSKRLKSKGSAFDSERCLASMGVYVFEPHVLAEVLAAQADTAGKVGNAGRVGNADQAGQTGQTDQAGQTGYVDQSNHADQASHADQSRHAAQSAQSAHADHADQSSHVGHVNHAGQPLNDFGHEVIPSAIARYRVVAYPFSDYWKDIGTIASFFEANLSLAQSEPPFNLYHPRWPFYTRYRALPPSRIVQSEILDSLVGEGADILGARIANSIVGVRSVIHKGSRLNKVVILGADFYNGERVLSSYEKLDKKLPPLGIGRDCVIEQAIIDKNVRIGDGVVIRAKPEMSDFQGDNHWVRDGITIIPKGSVIPSGTVI